MTDKEETKQVQGKPWDNCGVFDSYDEASKKMSHMIADNPTYNFKIRRCGDNGSQFKIKKRINKELQKVSKDIDEKLTKSKNKKSKNS